LINNIQMSCVCRRAGGILHCGTNSSRAQNRYTVSYNSLWI